MKMKNSIRIIATCASALTAGGVGAQSLDYAGLEALFGEPVTMSVTGSPQRASDVPASMLIITAEEIRRSAARDIPGVLSRLAGIDVRRTTREHADVAVRGYNEAFSPRLLVLVDGRQVYADYYGFTPWSAIPVELGAIRQIEVVKGPSGALFGFNAVGGVVNIVTSDPLHDMQEPTVAVTAGTAGLLQASGVSTLHIGDRTAVRISAGSRRSDEFDTPRQPADIAGDFDNERNAASVDARIELGQNSVLGLEATYSRADQVEFPPSYTVGYAQYETSSFRAHWQADTGLGLVRANVYRNDIANDAYQDDSIPLLRFDNNVVVAQLEDVFKVGTSHVVRVAGEYRDNEMATTPIGGARVHYDVVSLTGMSEWSATPTLSVTNAVRIDEWRLGREGFLPPPVVQAGVTNADWDVSRDELSFNSGIVWHAPGAGTVRFSAGKARQLPNLFSLGGFVTDLFLGVFLVGDPGLEPTNITNVELAWTHSLEGPGLDIGLGFFDGKTEDVQSVFFGSLGSSETFGFEASLGGQITERLRFDISLLEQDIDDNLNAAIPLGQTYTNFEDTSPERVIKGHVGWERGPFEFDGYVRYESDSAGLRVLDPVLLEASLVPIPSHVAVDARVGYELGEHLRLGLTGRNLTRSSQRQSSGLAVERELYLTVGYGF